VDRDGLGGLLFVAAMFIGGGIGMLLGNTGAGWILGMGAGFLLMALTRAYRVKVEAEKGVRVRGYWGSALLAAISALMLASGYALLVDAQWALRYIGGLVLIALGLIFLAGALKIILA